MVKFLVLFGGSWLLVDLIGYWLHRLAHLPKSPLYRAHMTHHVQNYPSNRLQSDSYRNSGADSLAVWFAPIVVLYWVVSALVFGRWGFPVMLGALPPAVLSTLVHDWTHLRVSPLTRTTWTRRLAYLHHIHHRNHQKNLGITIFWWDRIFGTFKKIRISTCANEV